MASRTDGDHVVTGRLSCTEFTPPAACIGDNAANASSPLGATKTRHRHSVTESQAHGSAAADSRSVVHVAHAAGTVDEVRAGITVACVGDSTITVDVKKNGTTILSAPISIDSGDAAFAKVDGVITDDDYVAGDVFEVIVDATVGTGTLGQGIFANIIFDELAG
jgi:hypothetical protein